MLLRFSLILAEGNVMVYSGGQVDPETGTAFLYRTIEELKTVSVPVGRGLSSTTTKVVTDQKYWLAKAEPLDDDIKQFDESWTASQPDAVLADPLHSNELNETTFSNPLFAESAAEQAPEEPVISFGRPLSMVSMSSTGPGLIPGASAVRQRRLPRPTRSSSSAEEAAFVQQYNKYLSGL
jgi:hypothetical protein